MTSQEIQRRVEAGQRRVESKREKILAHKEETRNVGKEILGQGFRLNYNLTESRWVSGAYRYDPKAEEMTVYFAVRSDKDQFSRPAAKRVILKHMKEGTHKLVFKVPEDQLKYMDVLCTAQIAERMTTHPHEFPSKRIAVFQETKRVMIETLTERLQKMEFEASIARQMLAELTPQ